MFSHIENYGFVKTIFIDNKNNKQQGIEWKGNYDGQTADIDVKIDENGDRGFVSMRLDNNDLKKLLGVQPIELSLEKRLLNDYFPVKKYKPITLEGALTKRKRRKYHRKRKNKTKKSH